MPEREDLERRLGRPFEEIKTELERLFDQEWEEIEVVVETAAAKRGITRADVIVDLVGRAESKPGVGPRIRRKLVRWIGKPWRERENPWDRFKQRIPPAPPRTDTKAEDLEEWTPLRPDEE